MARPVRSGSGMSNWPPATPSARTAPRTRSNRSCIREMRFSDSSGRNFRSDGEAGEIRVGDVELAASDALGEDGTEDAVEPLLHPRDALQRLLRQEFPI